MAQASVQGQVTLSAGSAEPFQGGEVLEVSIYDAATSNASTEALGENTISLQSGQSFPIPFDVSYDSARAATYTDGLRVVANIRDPSGKFVYGNAAHAPLVDGVQIPVVKLEHKIYH